MAKRAKAPQASQTPEEQQGFLRAWRYVFCSPECAALSPRAIKTLLAIALQYGGKNNGNLSAAMEDMRPRGITSQDQLDKGLAELIDQGFIKIIRHGHRRAPTLWAITWEVTNLDPKRGVPHEARPSHLWRAENASARDPWGTRHIEWRSKRVPPKVQAIARDVRHKKAAGKAGKAVAAKHAAAAQHAAEQAAAEVVARAAGASEGASVRPVHGKNL